MVKRSNSDSTIVDFVSDSQQADTANTVAKNNIIFFILEMLKFI